MFKVKSFDIKHPNPIFYRNSYTILNGEWDFYMDYKAKGERCKFYNNFPKNTKINVPYAYNTELSGLNIKDRCDNVWYHKSIHIDDLSSSYIFHIEGADYITKIWVNSKYVCMNQGAYHRISCDITEYLVLGDNEIVIKCKDSKSTAQPRGKQTFLKKNFMCWYEDTTGIFKDVWLERVPHEYLKDVKITPDRENKNISFIFDRKGDNKEITINISFDGNLISTGKYNVEEEIIINLDNIEEWNVLDPKLYDIEFIYGDDKVLSYAGFRSLKIEGSKIYLNDKELYQKLVLDQGYYTGGMLTAKAPLILNDIDNMIDMGFNGARKHQKRDDDRFYAYADMCGFLIWAEMPSAYRPSKKMRKNVKFEWEIIVKELYNHPSIINWTPINESWGVFLVYFRKIEQKFINELYDLTKAYDKTRFCLTNDGWMHTKSDFLTIHLYKQTEESLKNALDKAINDGRIKSIIKRPLHVYCKGYKYHGEPIILSEFGGTSFYTGEVDDWGYQNPVHNIADYEERLKILFNTVKADKRIVGYCYTQVSDVRQELNGLYTMDRIPKISSEKMREIQK